MTDVEIPKVCRDCKHCRRYQHISDWMPQWLSWKYKCDKANPGPPKEWSYEKNDYVCTEKEVEK